MALAHLQRLVGTWTTEIRHRLMPGEVVRGTDTFHWLAGEQFLIWDSSCEHPAFPVGHSIIGYIDEDRVGDDGTVNHDANARLSLQFFDSRGVFRVYQFTIDDTEWTMSRTAAGFSQRSRVTISGDTMECVSQLSEDGATWQDDIWITYRRK